MSVGKPPKYPGVKSYLAVRKQREARATGGFPNEGKPWTPEDYDLFVTLFVWGRGLDVIARRLGRTVKSVNTYVNKLPGGYHDLSGHVPRCTAHRHVKVWNERELWFLKVAHGKGWPTRDIARMLGRTPAAVEDRVEKMRQAGRGGFRLS